MFESYNLCFENYNKSELINAILMIIYASGSYVPLKVEWLLYLRKIYYHDAYKYLLGKYKQKPHLIIQLKLYLDKDIIRSGGRIFNSNMTKASKFCYQINLI